MIFTLSTKSGTIKWRASSFQTWQLFPLWSYARLLSLEVGGIHNLWTHTFNFFSFCVCIILTQVYNDISEQKNEHYTQHIMVANHCWKWYKVNIQLINKLSLILSYRMRDCGEDLLVDMSEVLFNELAFFKLMQGIVDVPNTADQEQQTSLLKTSATQVR